MTARIVTLAVLSIGLGTLSANAAAIGAPNDAVFGCDTPYPNGCTISLDELGHISAAFNNTVFGIAFLNAYQIAPTVNPAWVDSLGNPLQVTSYRVDSVNSIGFVFLGLIPGALGLCEFGVAVGGSACTGAAGDAKSDVLIFTNLGGGNNRIDFLSDNEAVFHFATDFNVLEVGPEGINGATYTGFGPNVENITYQIASDTIPEPSSLILLGSGLILASGKLYRRRTARK